MNEELEKLINEILRRRERAMEWRCPNEISEIERFVNITQNAGREEALYSLLLWIDDNIKR